MVMNDQNLVDMLLKIAEESGKTKIVGGATIMNFDAGMARVEIVSCWGLEINIHDTGTKYRATFDNSEGRFDRIEKDGKPLDLDRFRKILEVIILLGAKHGSV